MHSIDIGFKQTFISHFFFFKHQIKPKENWNPMYTVRALNDIFIQTVQLFIEYYMYIIGAADGILQTIPPILTKVFLF